MNNLIKVGILDDHPIVLSGLTNYLSKYPSIVIDKTFCNANEVLSNDDVNDLDVLLLDIQLPDLPGDFVAQSVLKKYPEIKIIAFTNLTSLFYVHNLLEIGIQGYVSKQCDPDNLVKAIEEVHKGQFYISPRLESELNKYRINLRKELTLKPSLTKREIEVLKLIVDGRTTQEIAKALFIGSRTVEHFRTNLYIKLEVKNMAEMIKKSIKLGLVES